MLQSPAQLTRQIEFYNPEWSRDGRTLLFESTLDGKFAIYAINVDGTGLRRLTADTATQSRSASGPARIPSPDGRHFAYTKSVDGASGLYVDERLVIGGPGAGPLGYLRTATLTAERDTFDTYDSPRDGAGPIVPGSGHYVVRVIRQVGARRWELADTWYDSTRQETARQFARTAAGGAPSIELETVRAPTDSASMLVTADRVTAWVVPAGSAPHLYDSAAIGERYNTIVVASAIARTRPAAGRVFLFPAYTLYGGSPVETRVDSMRVLRRDTLYAGQAALPVLVLERPNGGQVWVDEATGAELLSRGNAGPGRWWWHIRRGVAPPRVTRP